MKQTYKTIEIRQGQIILNLETNDFEVAERDFISYAYRIATANEVRQLNDEFKAYQQSKSSPPSLVESKGEQGLKWEDLKGTKTVIRMNDWHMPEMSRIVGDNVYWDGRHRYFDCQSGNTVKAGKIALSHNVIEAAYFIAANQPTQDRETDHIVEANKLVPAPTISGGAGSLNYLLDKFLEKSFQAMGRYNQHEKIEANEIRQAIITHAREVAEKEVKEAIVAFDVWRQENEYELNVRDQKVPAYTTSELYSLYLTFKNKKA